MYSVFQDYFFYGALIQDLVQYYSNFHAKNMQLELNLVTKNHSLNN